MEIRELLSKILVHEDVDEKTTWWIDTTFNGENPVQVSPEFANELLEIIKND